MYAHELIEKDKRQALRELYPFVKAQIENIECDAEEFQKRYYCNADDLLDLCRKKFKFWVEHSYTHITITFRTKFPSGGSAYIQICYSSMDTGILKALQIMFIERPELLEAR